MSLPVHEEIRLVARDDDREEQSDDHQEEFTESIFEIWEQATAFPVVVSIMGRPWTVDSTGPPPWVTETGDSSRNGRPSTTLETATSTGASSSFIPFSSTTVPISDATDLNGAHAGSSATPVATTAGLSTVSSAASMSCATSTDVQGEPIGAATSTSDSGGFNESNGGVTHPSGSNKDTDKNDSAGTPMGLILAGVIIPVLVISLLAFTAFVVMRRRRQRRDALASEEMKLHLNDDAPPPGTSSREMSMRGPSSSIMTGSNTPPLIREPSPQQSAAATAATIAAGAAAAAAGTAAAAPRTAAAATPAGAVPPPVIVSAMNPANNSSYFTGIDTSEALSIRTNSVRSSSAAPLRPAGFMLDGEFHEEPPPPYRPRSVPPISRGSSMRSRISNNAYRGLTTTSGAAAGGGDCASIQLAHDGGGSSTAGGSQQSPRSPAAAGANPFADPSDNVSFVSARNPFDDDDDTLSVVSDLSYQREPATVHQGV